MKPVETGVTDQPEDALALRAAADDPASLEEVCPYRLRAPLAPSVAARLEGITIDLAHLESLIRQRLATADVLLVEGAGGPRGRRQRHSRSGGAPARPPRRGLNRLGTVNHCAPTARVADAMGLEVLGVVLSQPSPARDYSADTNAATVAALTGLPILGTLPYLPGVVAAAEALRLPPFLTEKS
jgi:dethiobiotin synthetase